MSTSVSRLSFLLALLSLVTAAGTLAGGEAYRIRIHNKPGGLVQVSLDGGKTCGAVGRVKRAANAYITGFAASSYTPQGTVAATAVHGIRIKTGQMASGIYKTQMPVSFSICPLEFAEIPSGYGGHNPRSSAIHTDIHAGRSIFRSLSPLVGSPVFLERNHVLSPLPHDYIPAVGETLVIIVNRPGGGIREVVFENRPGGKVTMTRADGTSSVLTEVVRPVRGVGRYDGTTFTGVGAINTNHGGVITVSTAPVCPFGTVEGGAAETRGGFMIQPYYHVMKQGEASPQVMVVGPQDRSKPHLEGTPPLFGGAISLAWSKERPESSFRCQVRVDDGEWEALPALVGKIDDAFAPHRLESIFAGAGKPRKVKTGVTALRLLFPAYDEKLMSGDLAREVRDCSAKARESGMAPVRGTLELTPSKPPRRQCIVSYYVDGNLISASNLYPYICEWNTTRVANGLHILSIETLCGESSQPVVEQRTVLVAN